MNQADITAKASQADQWIDTLQLVAFKIIPIIIGIALLIVAVGYILNQRKKQAVQMSQLKKEGKEKATGIIFGKLRRKLIYSPTNSEGHAIVFGGSGLGKTSAILIPTLRSWNGTSFTIDISGDICKNVDMPNKLIYEPADPKSTPYNIFGPIDQIKDVSDKNEALEQLALLIMPNDEKAADASRFFRTEGRKILTASLIALYHKKFDFIKICETIVGNNWKDLFTIIEETENKNAIQYINSFEGTSKQNTSGCKQNCDDALKLFATNEKVKSTIRRPKKKEVSFTPEMLEKHNVFVIIEDTKLKLYAPLMNIITAQSLEFFSTRSNESKTMILFALDEFASFGRIEITEALRKLRKKHVRIIPLTQSMADIDLVYGREERMAMMNNFRFKVVLGADDTDTQEYFAKLIGYQDSKKHSKSTNENTTTMTESETKEFVVDPADLARLKDHLILLHPDGHIMLKKNFYFQ